MTGLAIEANFALNIALLLMLVVCGVAIARTRSLLAAILLLYWIYDRLVGIDRLKLG
jgi:hypothetical protein